MASTGTDRITFLAHIDQRTVGIAGGYREETQPTQVDLVSMWTSPEVRRTGTGRLLVRSVIDWAAETRASSVGLWVTRGNSPAQRLCESMGYPTRLDAEEQVMSDGLASLMERWILTDDDPPRTETWDRR